MFVREQTVYATNASTAASTPRNARVAESKPDALARPDTRRELEAVARFDGEARSSTGGRGTKFGAGLDRRVLGKLEDYLAKHFGRRR